MSLEDMSRTPPHDRGISPESSAQIGEREEMQRLQHEFWDYQSNPENEADTVEAHLVEQHFNKLVDQHMHDRGASNFEERQRLESLSQRFDIIPASSTEEGRGTLDIRRVDEPGGTTAETSGV